MPELLEAIGALDAAAFQWLRTHHSPIADAIMAGFSDAARGSLLWIGLAFLIAISRPGRWPAATQVFLALALSTILIDCVTKPFFNRARPFELDAATRVYGYKPTTRSFPSGHAAGAVAAAYSLARLAPEARSIFWVLGILVAFSRVYLGVHYPADVIAGALVGWGVARLVVGGTQWRFDTRTREA